MKVEMVNFEGMLTRAIVVQDDDECSPCENCGQDNYNHELLWKKEEEWCLDCNDTEFLSHFSDAERMQWMVNQMMMGNAVIVIRGYE